MSAVIRPPVHGAVTSGAGPAAARSLPAESPAAAPTRPALSLDRVEVRYGRGGPPVVRNVSLDVAAGEWLALIGPNGAGKSSLLRAAAGLVAHAGTVSLPQGTQIGPCDHRARARLVAYVAQQPVLPPGMTVAEYVLLGRTAHLGWLRAEGRADRRAAAEVLDRLDLARFGTRHLTAMSGGELQRVVLARALVQEAEVLLLDEPTSALDLGHGIGVLELVDELRRDRALTVISAMHDLGSAGRFADRLALLHQGELVAHGTPHEVLTEPILSRYYQTPVEVLHSADGTAVVVPLRTTRPPRTRIE
ncbi:MAG: ABC transporter ATP-binding protein [Acidimicrobiales bacterium]